ncbi:hypothetical protein GCM10007973_27320 [Polymorphobacter multimanifer]|uniref:PepSY domain-containing protein n=1 Tax=Polymorphobacter multimanifer TaxID=1070431 RepID=A0A841L215_9SPHN|nr:DUF6522 family protein [Polymorphobacter multimanifer]MBB6226356.1 hypothetical protein [Polymorphobacter multimanifer]GGI89475.1 hypothetical protein GCM10007973_27320 [Polymorphobacter multimanifer]
MADITRDGEDFVVAAEVIATALHLAPADVPGLLRAGSIKTLSEEGVGDDEGRWRLTFNHNGRRLRLVVDATGAIVTRSVVDFGRTP